jgi:hypothetical protein
MKQDLIRNGLNGLWSFRKFWDEAAHGYFTSPEGDPSIVLRLKEDQVKR